MYSVKETALKLEVSTRAVQKRCKRDNIRKKDNKYLITDEHVEKWRLEIESNEPQTNQTNEPIFSVRTDSQLDLEIEALKIENTELKEELEQYEITENERIEVFTNEEYQVFEQRLTEWRTLQKDIEHQQELFKAKEEGSEQVIEHYKKQFEYQKEQSTRILEIHERLIQAVDKQNNIILQKPVMEAVDKDIISKDNWKRKD